MPFRIGAKSVSSLGLWIWAGAPEYKNDVLTNLQRKLIARGITNKEHLKYFAAQAIQENGAFDHMATHGDKGCALGIPQYNTCVNENQTSKIFLSFNPKWQSREFQIAWLADRMAAKYTAYNGDIRLAIIAHNRPASAAKGQDRCMYFGERYSCYYRDEVSSKLKLLMQEK